MRENFVTHYDADERYVNNRKAKKKTVVPRRRQEKIAIAELLNLSNAFVETPGRSFTSDFFWDIVPTMETVLTTEEDGSESSVINNTREESVCRLFDTTVSIDEPTDETEVTGAFEGTHNLENALNFIETEEIQMLDSTSPDDEIEGEPDNEFRNIVDYEEIESTSDERTNGVVGTTTTETSGAESSEIVCGKSRKVKRKVSKVKINSIILQGDVFKLGQEKLIKMKLPITRRCRKARQKREQEHLFGKVYKNLNDNNMDPLKSIKDDINYANSIDKEALPHYLKDAFRLNGFTK